MHTQLCVPCRQWWGRTICFQKSRQYPWSSRHETRPCWRISQSVWLRVLWTRARVWRKRLVRWCILGYSLLGGRRGRPSCRRWIRGSRWGRSSFRLWNWGQWSQGGDFMRGGCRSLSQYRVYLLIIYIIQRSLYHIRCRSLFSWSHFFLLLFRFLRDFLSVWVGEVGKWGKKGRQCA